MRVLGKIRVKIGAILMLFAMLVSDGAILLSIYFLSASLHEFGHLIAARALRIDIEELRFDFSGVRICTERAITSYGSEFVLAAAGPLVNFLSVTISVLVFLSNSISVQEAAEAVLRFFDGEPSFVGSVGFFAAASLLQGGINLLPINTLDGGRMLFCVSAQLFGDCFASLLIKATSYAAAFVLWTVALYLLLKVSAGLGVFVFAACVFASTMQNNDKSAILG